MSWAAVNIALEVGFNLTLPEIIHLYVGCKKENVTTIACYNSHRLNIYQIMWIIFSLLKKLPKTYLQHCPQYFIKPDNHYITKPYIKSFICVL